MNIYIYIYIYTDSLYFLDLKPDVNSKGLIFSRSGANVPNLRTRAES